jgi:sulfur-oxidizing protein SoxY
MSPAVTRRAFAGGLLVSLVPLVGANATPDTLRAAIAEVAGGRPLREGKVLLDIQPLVDNGNTVPMRVRVDGETAGDGRVRAIHVFNEKNPQPHVVSVRFGPRAGRAEFATRIKLADTQKVVAIAELADGTLWTAAIDVIVTIAACIEGIE